MTNHENNKAARIDTLLEELNDLLDAHYSERRILRAFTNARNAMPSKGGPAEEMRNLAAELRRAAEVADEIADLA